jgi:hypothetical protein
MASRAAHGAALQDLTVTMGADHSESAYSEALVGLIELLGLVDEKSWRDVLAKHLDDWTRARDVRSHLGVYGGMGSFNDTYLTAANGHRVSPAQEGWANECFEVLKHVCWTSASRIAGARPGADEGAEPASAEESALQGWVCRGCGQRYIDQHWLQFTAAGRWARQAVPRAIASAQAAAVARRAYAFDEDPECLVYLRELQAVVDALAYPAVPDDFDFTGDGCARCGGRDWAVFHWDVLEGPLRLQESAVNLPVPPQPVD